MLFQVNRKYLYIVLLGAKFKNTMMQISFPQRTDFSKGRLKTSTIDPFNHSLYISGVHYRKSIQRQLMIFLLKETTTLNTFLAEIAWSDDLC